MHRNRKPFSQGNKVSHFTPITITVASLKLTKSTTECEIVIHLFGQIKRPKWDKTQFLLTPLVMTVRF